MKSWHRNATARAVTQPFPEPSSKTEEIKPRKVSDLKAMRGESILRTYIVRENVLPENALCSMLVDIMHLAVRENGQESFFEDELRNAIAQFAAEMSELNGTH